MLDHIGIKVTDYGRSKRFYEQALAPLGYRLQMEHTISGAGFGPTRKPIFWISVGVVPSTVHIAFGTHSRSVVDSFHAAALASGGRDNGKPGLRPEYHPNYYGAFVLDPDGYNIEAVCHHEGSA